MLMIKRFFAVVGLGCFFISLAACEVHFDGGDYVKGSGDAISKDITADEFTQLVLKSSADVMIKVGPEQSIKITADDNLIEMFSFNVDDKTLIVDHEGSYSTRIGTLVEITVPELEVIAIKGSGEIVVDDVKGEEFIALISGSGDIILRNVQVAKLELEIDGSGDIEADGSAHSLLAEVNGSGDIDLLKLEAKSAQVTISGSGDIEVNTSESLKAKVNGSGDIRYLGSPELSTKVNGSGDIESI